jgi:hypothetical protein
MRVGTIEQFEPGNANQKGRRCLVKFTDGGNTSNLAPVQITDLRPVGGESFAASASRPSARTAGSRQSGTFLSAEEQTIMADAEGVMQAVTTILKEDALPFGWEEAFTNDGKKYYIDHASQSTSWAHPSNLIVEQGGATKSNRPKPPTLSALSKLESLSHETYG